MYGLVEVREHVTAALIPEIDDKKSSEHLLGYGIFPSLWLKLQKT